MGYGMEAGQDTMRGRLRGWGLSKMIKDMTKAKGQIVPLAMVFKISLDLLVLGREVAT